MLQFLKYPATPHWRVATHYLGEDDHGVWLVGRPGSRMQKGDAPPLQMRELSVHLIPRHGWTVLSFHPQHETMSHFVDAATPADFQERQVVTIDLDLDAIRYHSGEVIIDDHYEFELHQQVLSYPTDLVAAAQAAMETASADLAALAEPYGAVCRAWWEEAARRWSQ